jgi:CRP-like cAMP-binding protein
MNASIEAYIKKMAPDLSQEEAKAIAKDLPTTTFPKGKILVRQGEVAKDCYFVLKGLLRTFFITEEGEEKTVDFLAEEESFVVLGSYEDGQASPYSLECLEDCVLLIGDLNQEETLHNAHPELSQITRKVMDIERSRDQEDLVAARAFSSKERFLDFLERRPGLAARVPQYQLASYLGITPETLSRIKGRLSRKEG